MATPSVAAIVASTLVGKPSHRNTTPLTQPKVASILSQALTHVDVNFSSLPATKHHCTL
ncbi:pullulanase [Sesbania bispinosa]|nr:pullulanase [Sesbania bispinosa]